MNFVSSCEFTNSAPEARKKVAHDEIVGLNVPENSSSGRSGRNFKVQGFFRPIRGLGRFEFETHSFTVGYFRSLLRSFQSAAVAFLISLPTFRATAQTTNTLSDAEIKGRKLAQQLFNTKPETNSIIKGWMNIKTRSGTDYRYRVSLECGPTQTNWSYFYTFCSTTRGVDRAVSANSFSTLKITHSFDNPVHYEFFNAERTGSGAGAGFEWSEGKQSWSSVYKQSDFYFADLGLEFFHWPEQKILPKPTNLKRGREYTLLESTNPNLSSNSYLRVVSWIDTESGGILEAQAYDSKNKLLKVFEPKEFKKVNGSWQLQEMEIRNVQTGSRTRMEFDLPDSN